LKQKIDLEKEKKELVESAAAKDVTLKKKIGTIGNIVHDSVPVNDNEVCRTSFAFCIGILELIQF
jgi:seryl-tRNA synthetase